MKLKTIEVNGATYAVIENGHPVYTHPDGKEIPFDAAQATGKIASLNAEAKTHREAKEAVEAQLKKFAGIDDPVKAQEAMQTVLKIDQKKLIDAGEVDQVKAAITKEFQAKLDESKQENEKLSNLLNTEMIGGRFNGSKYIADKLAIPADFVQARFGQSFKIEDGKVVAYDAAGNKVFSRAKPGELAEFDEALEHLVEQYPQKDHILKGTGHNGNGTPPSQFQQGQKTMKRAAFDALSPADRVAAAKDKITIVD